MSGSKLIFIYSTRLVVREWRRFVLPLLSLTVTSIVLMLILLLTGSSAELLTEQARALQGGDIVLESSSPIAGEEFFKEVGIVPTKVSDQLEFSGTLLSESASGPFTVKVIDETYPLYGSVTLRDGVFKGVADGELFMDEAGLPEEGRESLKVLH